MEHDPRGDPAPSETTAPLLASRLAQRLLDLVRARPGLSMREATRALGASWATVTYHRRALERQGLLRTDLTGSRRVFHPRDPPLGPTLAACRAMLEGPTARAVAALVQVESPLDCAQVAERLDLSANAARHHLHRLVAAGLVTAAVPMRLEGLAPTPLLDLLLGEPPAEDDGPGAVRLLSRREPDDASTR